MPLQLALPALPAISFQAIFAVIPDVPPWMIVGMLINYAANIQTYKRTAFLVWKLLKGGSQQAGCALCDEIVERILDVTGVQDSTDKADDLACTDICPWGIKKCITVCERLLEAIRHSGKYPCVAIGMCAEMDEFGPIPRCKFDWTTASCSPPFACSMIRTIPWPKCQLKEGYSKWRKVSSLMSRKAGAMLAAVANAKKCGDEGADPYFCVNEAKGFSLICEWLGYVLVFVVATVASVRAVETPGGDDDRQWLCFWIIFFLFTLVERFTSVFLSQLFLYYPLKLVVLFWLVMLEGAAEVYSRIHRIFKVMRRWAKRYYIQKFLSFFFLDKLFTVQGGEPSEQDVIEDLEASAANSSLELVAIDARTLGTEELYRKFTSPSAISFRYSERVLRALTKRWSEMEVRYLEVHLLSARNLPVMDYSVLDGAPESCDPFVVLYLVPPHGAKELGKREKKETKEKKHGEREERGTPRCMVWADMRASLEGLLPWDAIEWLRTLRLLLWLQHTLPLVANHVPHFFRGEGWFATAGIGPNGAYGQYARTSSRTVERSLNPHWNEHLELRLEGGFRDASGSFINLHAPYTSLRVEVWDQDWWTSNDFIGEFTVPLCMLMDGRTHEVECELTDPEFKSKAKPLSGRLRLRLKYSG